MRLAMSQVKQIRRTRTNEEVDYEKLRQGSWGTGTEVSPYGRIFRQIKNVGFYTSAMPIS